MVNGHIDPRKNKDGTTSYQVVIELERDPVTGKRVRQYKTVKGTKKQAEAVLRKMQAACENGNVINATPLKVGDWMRQWLDNYLPNIEATTRDGYEEKLRNYILPGLGHIQLKMLRADHVQCWINDLSRRGLSPKTIRNAFNNLNAAMKRAVILRMLPFNPCDGVVLPKLVKPKTEVYNQKQARQVLAAAEGTDIYLLVLLGLSVGFRRGELAALRWESVNFEQSTIRICDNRVHASTGVVQKAPKSEAGNRTIRVGTEVISALKAAKAAYDKAAQEPGFHDLGYVICKADGTPYHPDSLTQKWERFTARHGLPHIKLHGLRHTNATSLIGAGVNEKVVCERLGHADVSTTLRSYTHVLPTMDADAAVKMDGILFDD